MKGPNLAGLSAAIAVVFAGATGAARASSITVEGITYSLTESTLTSTPTSTEDQFTLTITGINSSTNSALDGRYGVNAFAFNQPTGFSSASAPPGFNTLVGGLNSSGCNMHGNFYCFMNQNPPTTTLAPGSSLTYTFDVTAAGNNPFSGYDPSFKIEWLGTQNNYSLVSQPLAPTVVPLPASLPLLISALAGLGLVSRVRRQPLVTASR